MTNFIDQNDIDKIILSILAGSVDGIIKEFGQVSNSTFPDKSNYDVTREKVQELIDVCRIKSTAFNLAILRSGDVNKIDVNIFVTKDIKDTHMHFYLSGRNLNRYNRNLPHIVVHNNKTGGNEHYPRNGSNYSKWYPFIGNVIPHMINIATNLRLYELYLRSLKKNDDIRIRPKNVIGLDVPLQIPTIFEPYLFLAHPNSIKSIDNPEKISTGTFLYKQNGVANNKLQFMINYIARNFTHLKELIFPKLIDDFNLHEFYSSKYIFAISTWNRHARLLVKNASSVLVASKDEFYNASESKVDIYVIDPWMKKLPKIIFDELLRINQTITINFLKRTCNDQGSEGSCALCCVSRLLYIVTVFEIDKIFQIVNDPIPDFYAYLTFYIFKNS